MIDDESGKVSFLILDRSVDLGSILIHDFYFEPAVNDILDVNNNVYTSSKGKYMLSDDQLY